MLKRHDPDIESLQVPHQAPGEKLYAAELRGKVRGEDEQAAIAVSHHRTEMSSPRRRRAIRLAAYTDSEIVGGGEKSLATLLRNLDEQIEVTVVGTSADTVHEVAAGRADVRTRLVRPVNGKRDLAGMAAHLRAVREIRPDILQTNGQPWSCQYALSAGVLTRGVRTLAVYHAVIPPISRAQVWRNRRNLKRLDAQVAVSRAAARATEQMVGLASGTVRVVHNGVEDRPITPLARPVPGPIVGSVGGSCCCS